MTRVADRFDRRVEALLARHAQLRLEVQVGSRNERVDAALRGWLNRPRRFFEVLAVAARQAGDDRPADLRGHAPHRLGIRRRGDREAGLDDVHPEQIELTGQQQLFRHPEREPGRLLAVAQRRVENSNLLGHRANLHAVEPASPKAWRGARAGSGATDLPVDATGKDLSK
jgi:hypothetical protein